MSSVLALLPAARSMSADAMKTVSRYSARTAYRPANLPDTRRTENYLEEPMIHDLYLMSATPWLEAATKHHFQHRALTFAEMAASGKHRGKPAQRAQKAAAIRTKGLFLAMIEGVLHV